MSLSNRIKKISTSKPSLYFALFLCVKVRIDAAHLSFLVTCILSGIFILIELVADLKPQFVSYVYINRWIPIATVFLITTLVSIYAYSRFKHLKQPFEIYNGGLNYVFQGVLLGVILRMLLIHYFSRVVSAKDIEYTRLLIMMEYLVMILIYPFSLEIYIIYYSLGIGLGFLLHYLVRKEENRRAVYARLTQNIISTIQNLKDKNTFTPTSDQEKAIRYYIKMRWRKLQSFFGK